jgi:hypothetical protein
VGIRIVIGMRPDQHDGFSGPFVDWDVRTMRLGRYAGRDDQDKYTRERILHEAPD